MKDAKHTAENKQDDAACRAPSQSAPGPHERRAAWLMPVLTLLGVLGVVLATYWPALSARALYMDDKFYLGPLTQHPSWAGVKAIFGEVFSPSMVNGYYQPLSLLSIMADFLTSTETTSLLPFHRTALLLHLLNVALVVALLSALFRNWLTAALLGLLYGLHPLNADAVLWIAERKTVLSTTFALSSLLLYVSYARQAGGTERGDWKRYSASLFMYVCAVLAKPTALPVVALLPILDYWPLGRLSRKTWLEKLPFLLVCVVFLLVTAISQSRSGDGGTTQFMRPHYVPLVMGYSFGFYLLKLVYPARLVSDYPWPQPFGLANPAVLACTAVALAAVVAIGLSVRRTRAWLAGGLFFVIAIFPTLGIIRYTSSITANRSLYLPMVGLLLPLAWQLNRLKMKTGLRALVATAGLALVIASAAATRAYESYWRDSLTLLQSYIKNEPNEGKFHTRLGNEWIVRRDVQAAITEFREAARLTPDWTENHLNLGRALFSEADYAGAKQAFARALQQTPEDWRAHMLMGSTLVRQQELEGALQEFRTAARLAPNQPQPHFDTANVLARQGKLDEAAEEFRQTLRRNPRFTPAQMALNELAAKRP